MGHTGPHKTTLEFIMQYRNGQEYTPTCGGSGPIPYRDDRGRSVRCGECLTIAVHGDDGNTDSPYVHWTDLASCGHAYITPGHNKRNAANGRLIVDQQGVKRCK